MSVEGAFSAPCGAMLDKVPDVDKVCEEAASEEMLYSAAVTSSDFSHLPKARLSR